MGPMLAAGLVSHGAEQRQHPVAPASVRCAFVREVFTEGGGFEERAAYSRAVRIGAHVAVSGTAARGGGDAYEQAKEALTRALAAALELGARREDVLRTRLLLAPGCDWESVIAAHRETFEGVAPANTTYFVGGFIPDGVLVEVELDAIVCDKRSA